MLCANIIKFFIVGFLLSSCASFSHKKLENPYFWVASKDDTKIYILGTFHYFVSIDELPSEIINHLKASELLLMESTQAQWEIVNKKVYRKYLSSQKGLVRKKLSSEEWKFYLSIYEKSEVGQKNLKNGYKPGDDGYFEALRIMQPYIDELKEKTFWDIYHGSVSLKPEFLEKYNTLRRELKFGESLDWKILVLGRENNLRVDYLDRSFDDKAEIRYISIEDSFKEQFQKVKTLDENHLKSVLYDYEFIKSMSEMATKYRAGRERDFYVPSTRSRLRKLLLPIRNKTWSRYVSEIDQDFKQIFVAAGVAHMYGEGSFLSLLKKQGYKIDRITDFRLN